MDSESATHPSPQSTGDPEDRDPQITETVSAGTLDLDDLGSEELPIQRGACFGRYIVISPLGQGGMGQVFATYDPELDRQVALKILRRGGGSSSQERLRREARAAARLSHPNVVAVHDVGTVGHRVFLAMELVRGRTLGAWLAHEKPPWREVLDVFVQAGRGLEAAHQAGLVHRDFKPGNVMIADDGAVKVLDFGLARLEGVGAADGAPSGDSPELGPLTLTGQILGTPAYLAPEAAAGGALDPRADQFSFCVALNEALFRRRPFAGSSPEEVRQAMARGEVEARPEGSEVPVWLEQAVARGLATRPEERYSDLGSLLAALERDPSTRLRRRLGGLAVAASVLAVLAAFALRPGAAPLCQGGEVHLQGVWDPPARQSMAAAFGATGLDYAAASLASTEAHLDRYAGDWVDTRQEVCRATHLRGEQSEVMLDLQMACLDSRLVEMKALVELLREADGSLVRRATEAAGRLPNLSSCLDRRGLSEVPPPPEDADSQERLASLREGLARAGALESAGRYGEAVEVAQRSMAEAEELGYRPVLAQAHFRLGRNLGRMGRLADFEEELLQALTLAQATRDQELLTETLNSMILISFLRGAGEEGRRWARLAEGAAQTLREPGEAESLRYFYLGMIAKMEGQHEEAIGQWDRALEVDPEVTPRERLDAHNNKALALSFLGRLEEAEAILRQSLQEAGQALGTRHPHMANVEAVLGNVLAEQGRHAAALETHRGALELYQEMVGPEHPGNAPFVESIGNDLLELGAFDEASESLRQAHRLRSEFPGNPWDLARCTFRLARAIDGASPGSSEARELALAALAAFRQVDPEDPEIPKVESWLQERA